MCRKQNIFDFPINLIKKESTDNETKTINEKDAVDYEKELVIPKGKNKKRDNHHIIKYNTIPLVTDTLLFLL